MKTKVAYKEGKFTDFKGVERPFVIAAVSVEENLVIPIMEEVLTLRQKGVYFGISVLHPTDLGNKPIIKGGVEIQVPIYNVEIGKTIAKNKALKPETCINYVSSNEPGILSADVINTMLDQEARYFSANPSKYLAGYEKARINYNFEGFGGFEKEAELKTKKAELEKLEKEIESLKLKARKTKN